MFTTYERRRAKTASFMVVMHWILAVYNWTVNVVLLLVLVWEKWRLESISDVQVECESLSKSNSRSVETCVAWKLQ